MPKLTVINFSLALACWLLCSCGQAKTEAEPTRRQLSGIAFEDIQEIATDACLCEQRTANGKGCWQKYRTALKEVDISSGATACAPISTVSDCFQLDGKEVCVVTGYSVNGVTDGGSLCRPEDARAADMAYSAAVKAHPKWSDAGHEAGQKALLKVLQRIRAGEKMALSQSGDGCV